MKQIVHYSALVIFFVALAVRFSVSTKNKRWLWGSAALELSAIGLVIATG
jgi:hypothetical protein